MYSGQRIFQGEAKPSNVKITSLKSKNIFLMKYYNPLILQKPCTTLELCPSEIIVPK